MATLEKELADSLRSMEKKLASDLETQDSLNSVFHHLMFKLKIRSPEECSVENARRSKQCTEAIQRVCALRKMHIVEFNLAACKGLCVMNEKFLMHHGELPQSTVQRLRCLEQHEEGVPFEAIALNLNVSESWIEETIAREL